MLLAAALALSMAGQDGQMSALPASLARGALAACAPATLAAAEQCLRESLSPEDLAILEDRIPARRFRPKLDCEIETAWHLEDRSSPMSRVMDGLLGLHHPHLAAGMIITDLQVRAHDNVGFGFDDIREGLRQHPPPAPDPADCQSSEARPS